MFGGKGIRVLWVQGLGIPLKVGEIDSGCTGKSGRANPAF